MSTFHQYFKQEKFIGSSNSGVSRPTGVASTKPKCLSGKPFFS